VEQKQSDKVMQEDEDISEERPEGAQTSLKGDPSEADDGEESVPEDSNADDDVYVDEEVLENMDLQEDLNEDSDDDFKTMKESEMGEDDQLMYQDGQIMDDFLNIENDSVCQLSLVHQDHVYCIA